MKKAKLIKNNNQNRQLESNPYSIKNLFIIVLIISVVFSLFYLITYLLVKPVQNSNESNEITEFDSTKITLSHLLDRNENEYFVLVTKESLYDGYNSKINYSELYNNYISNYKATENSLQFYYVDLDDALNKNYISEDLNISNNINQIKLNNEVLFKIKNKKIEEYYVGNSDILKVLKELSN